MRERNCKRIAKNLKIFAKMAAKTLDKTRNWFESSYPSQFMHDFVNKQHKIVHIFYFYTLPLRLILAENRRLGRDWGVNGEQKTPAIGYKA